MSGCKNDLHQWGRYCTTVVCTARMAHIHYIEQWLKYRIAVKICTVACGISTVHTSPVPECETGSSFHIHWAHRPAHSSQVSPESVAQTLKHQHPPTCTHMLTKRCSCGLITRLGNKASNDDGTHQQQQEGKMLSNKKYLLILSTTTVLLSTTKQVFRVKKLVGLPPQLELLARFHYAW